jgi:excisionase family DNA binding protein
MQQETLVQTATYMLSKAAIERIFDGPSLFRSLLTIEEAADYLGMSAKWLYRNYQDLPHVKIGGGTKPRIRFKSADLDGWIAAHTCDWRKA